MKQTKEVWRLRRGMDRRFRSGHPWVYSNELMESPKGLPPGDPVELQDAAGKFLARGYGNSKSLIAFRCLSRDPQLSNPSSVESVLARLQRAGSLRAVAGLGKVSHRLCFGEADFLPGLVIDRYVLSEGQIFVVQAHSAGADRIAQNILEILERYVESRSESGERWEKTAVVLRNDLRVRLLEGLAEEKPQVLRDLPGVDLNHVGIQVASVLTLLGKLPLHFRVNLLTGQKTGFFLDQYANIQLAAWRFQSLGIRGKIRILDLCCYVGQWGAQLGRVFSEAGLKVEVVAVDLSAQALEYATLNIRTEQVQCEVLKANVLKDLDQIPERSFDLVIADPPAFIQNRKDLPTGSHAYLQLATQVFRIVRQGGGVVCCSCSGLLDEEAFTQILTKAAQRNHVSVQWLGRGAQAPDHPMLTEFPEGRYLKGWMGILN